jgi:predicted RNA-binding protein with PUA-like domain
MQYWLIKSEPETYSLEDLIKENIGRWDGVRNYAARNNLKAMQLGDMCLFYHSVKNPAVVGLCTVVKEHYPDPTSDSDAWVAVDVKFHSTLKKNVPLAKIKANPALVDMALLRLSRLSVQPVTDAEFDEILRMSDEV